MALSNQLQTKNQSNRRRATRPFACLFPALILLAACSNSENESALLPDAVEVPPLVQQMMDAEFPADGEINVQSQGTITITPDTSVCRAQRLISPALRELAPRFLGPGLGAEAAARSAGTSAKLGGDLGGGKICTSDGKNVINQWRLTHNRDGKPYKFVLAVWQGNPDMDGAAWVGRVERLDGVHPDVLNIPPPQFGSPEEAKLQGSIFRDHTALAQAFIEHLTAAE